eukprot:TRINITY_DN17633_c0_g1_i1.p1 TRINITY_DN17633_c0_g1~~TRINITY_DN17633_c0_g1_i1.p1  ORF type:complete len:506 (+),score=88.60 TRINITY_DN17633_c0_g1_i1:43-1560(+)
MRTPTRRTLAKHASDSPLRRFDNENRSLHTKPKPLSQFVSPALVLYLVVTIGAGFFFGSLMRKSGNIAQPYFQSRDSTPVRRMVVSHSQRNSIAKQLAQEGAPVILTFEGLQHEWTAFSLWNPDYIQRKVQRLPSVYKGMNQTFLYFDDSKPLADSDLVDWKSPFHVEDLDSREFFRKIESSSQSNTSPLGEEEASPNMNTNTPDSKYHYYFSGDIDSVPSLSDDIGDTDFLAVTEEGKVINVWMGQSGVTAQAHYDSFHNFYVQITGEKRFYLVPPGNHLNMYLYPRSHPSYRQSQVDFQSFSSQRWPRLSGIPVYRADLKPGDVLYLPPYWFHHVVAIDNSMSVNVWCDSAEYTISSAIWQSPLPFEESWDTATRSQKVSAYILVLLTESLDGQGNDDGDAIDWKSSVARKFITDLKETRFDNIFHSNAHSHTISRHIVCSNYVPTLDHGHRLAESARSLSSKFKEIALPVRQLLLGNFVEDLILWSVGVDGMYDMLRSCVQS